MKIFGKEIIITKNKVKQILVLIALVGALGWGVYALFSGADPADNPIPGVLAPVDSIIEAAPDTLLN